MTAAPFVGNARRVLVVSPSVVVREQLVEAFTTFADLKRTNAISQDVAEPAVTVVVGGAKRETWRDARAFHVVVGNVHSVSPHFERVAAAPPKDLFDMVLVDEAHHAPADAWRVLLEATKGRAVLFTATPFRADRLSLPGEVVYNYPLRRAIDEGVYRPVDFRPVSPAAGEDKDLVLARAAIERLNSHSHEEAGSRLIVRTDRVEKAERLVDLYSEQGTSLGLVVSSTLWPKLQEIFAKVRAGDLKGIVCVGSLTEGFDMPALRIAAYHSPHQTLAPTLQFVGRLARPGLNVNGELLAAVEDVGAETEELYREDPAWAELLPKIFDAAVAAERAVRRFIGDSSWEGKPLALPPLAVTPPRSARIFRSRGVELNLDIDPRLLGQADVVWRFLSPEKDLLALVTAHRDRPLWLHADVLDVWRPELHLACHVRGQEMLFIASNLTRTHNDLRRRLGADPALPIAGTDLQQLAWNIAPANWFSIGLRPTRVTGASYEQVGGRRVEAALPDERLFARVLGHGIAGGGGGTFGFSVAKAKFWEPESTTSLLDFRDWCTDRSAKLREVAATRQGLPGLPGVGIGRAFNEFPTAPILATTLDYGQLAIEVRFVDEAGSQIAVHELELVARRNSGEAIELELQRFGEAIWLGVQDPTGEVTAISGSTRAVRLRTGEVLGLDEFFADERPTILFTDGTSVFGSMLTEARIHHRSVDPVVLDRGEWAGVDIETEIGDGADGQPGVQQALAQQLSARCDLVLTDHGSYELADLFGLTIGTDGSLRLEIIHCKAAAAAQPRRQLEDIGEVLQQAVRSSRWADPASQLCAELLTRLDRRPNCRLLHDPTSNGLAQLQALVDRPPAIEAIIFAVQPGLDMDQVAGWEAGESLINVTADWCRLVGGADFRLVGNVRG